MSIKEVLITELNEIRDNPIYFMESYVKLNNFSETNQFEATNFTVDFVKHVRDNRLSCIEAERQTGKTTISMAYALWTALTNPEPLRSTVIFHNNAVLRNAIDNMEYMIKMLPLFLCDVVRRETENSWKLNHSVLVLDTADKVQTVEFNRYPFYYQNGILILDEYAYFPLPFENRWVDRFARFNPDTKIVLISTRSECGTDFDNRMEQTPVRFEPISI